MKDRVVEHPNRYRLVPVAGEPDVVDLVPVPGKVTEQGTAICKETLLADATAALYGLGANAVPDDALMALALKFKDTMEPDTSGQYSFQLGNVVFKCGITGENTNVTFTTPFAHDCIYVALTVLRQESYSGAPSVGYWSKDSHGISNIGSGGTPRSRGVLWIAIGY